MKVSAQRLQTGKAQKIKNGGGVLNPLVQG